MDGVGRRVALAERLPHVFSIQYPPSRALFRGLYRADHDAAAVRALRRTLVYLHVPFCAAKCHYCNFAVDVRRDPGLHRGYVDALVVQVGRVLAELNDGCGIAGIDVGGGTPTLLAEAQLERVLVACGPLLRRAEVAHALSIETTPWVAANEPAKLAMMRDLGVARVSVGVQSTNDEVLADVNRGSQRALVDAALTELMRAGFRRVNVDLVFGLPGQTPASFREDLLRVVGHGVDSTTTYDCLYRGQGRALPHKSAALPTMDAYRALYDLAYELLHAHGYAGAYGSLNYARHAGETGTSPYFEGRLLHGLPYVGLGSYASSLVGERWWFAPHATGAYVAAIGAGAALPAGDSYVLPAAERMAKAALAMLNFGVIDRASFIKQFGCSVDSVFAPAIEHALANRWLEDRGERLGVVAGRFDVLPVIRGLFYADAAIDWVERSGRRLPLLRDAAG